nr:uncharacterized protein LOC123754996 isoform X1 [Procambarus clarkii]
MSLFRYSAIGFCTLVGSEVIIRCLKNIYCYFVHHKLFENHANFNTVTENSMMFSEVIFFPDYGIVSETQYKVQDHSTNFSWSKNDNAPQSQSSEGKKPSRIPNREDTKPSACLRKGNGNQDVQWELKRNAFLIPKPMFNTHSSTSQQKEVVSLKTKKQNNFSSVSECNGEDNFECDLKSNPFLIPCTLNLTSHHHDVPTSHNGQIHNTEAIENKIFKPYGYLKRSTSLIHIINALESAKRSLSICIYVLTCKDLLDAVVRAKQRGVRVRVLLETEMASSSEVAIKVFHKHNILFRCSKPALLMHHKFAVIDAPEQQFTAASSDTYVERKQKLINSEQCEVDHNYLKDRNHTGSIVHSRLSNLWKKNETYKFFSKLFSQCKTPAVKAPQNYTCDGVLLTGSFNWTWSAVISNNENVIITNHPQLVNKFAHEFENLWTNLDR